MGLSKATRGLLLAAAYLLPSLFSSLSVAEPDYLRLKTDRGTMILELYPDKAPATVANFLDYVDRYYYDGLVFHRVVEDFVIQSGAYSYDMIKKESGDPVVNESANGLKNRRGTIAMARHADPDSATSQFYINLNDNPNLDPVGDKSGYTVFGKVIEGMEVADAIGGVAVAEQGKFTHLPAEPVQILSMRRIDKP